MIALSQARNPSQYVRLRARSMWVRARRGGLEWVVIPKQKHKARRLVRFSRRETGVIVIECNDYHTNAPCKANEFSRLCSHAERVLMQIEVNEKRRQKRERAA